MTRVKKKDRSLFWMILVIVLSLALLFFLPGIREKVWKKIAGDTAQAPRGGEAWEIRSENIPSFSKEEKAAAESFQRFTPLDRYGRCGTAFACLTRDMMPEGDREDIREVYPTGWDQQAYPGLIEEDYLYNRCHLIAYQLTGENVNEENIITGTRFLNTQGMLPFENEVASYLRLHPQNHVLYRVTPDFQRKELLARGVLMEAWSVEDNGALHFCVYCYNIQPGVLIDYTDGESSLDLTYHQEEERAS